MSIADELVENQAPYIAAGGDLEGFLRALGAMWEGVEVYYLEGPNGEPAWSVLWDVDACPTEALPWLAQVVGERLPEGVSDDPQPTSQSNPLGRSDARTWIADAPNQQRGTPAAVARAAKRWLTGGRVVQILERHRLDGSEDVDCIAVRVFASETPRPQRVKDEIRSVLDASVELDFSSDTTATWSLIAVEFATWADVAAACATWADVANQQGFGYTSW